MYQSFLPLVISVWGELYAFKVWKSNSCRSYAHEGYIEEFLGAGGGHGGGGWWWWDVKEIPIVEALRACATLAPFESSLSRLLRGAATCGLQHCGYSLPILRIVIVYPFGGRPSQGQAHLIARLQRVWTGVERISCKCT
jgi:hypothetical protein